MLWRHLKFGHMLAGTSMDSEGRPAEIRAQWGGHPNRYDLTLGIMHDMNSHLTLLRLFHIPGRRFASLESAWRYYYSRLKDDTGVAVIPPMHIERAACRPFLNNLDARSRRRVWQGHCAHP
jgi:hypothetical protein